MRSVAPIIAARFCLLACCLAATSARAQSLHYVAPDGCPPQEILRAAIAEGLGRAPVDGPETVSLHVAADRSAADVALVDGQGAQLGSRRVRSPTRDCEALVRAAGLSAGLALAPLRLPAVEAATPSPPAPARPSAADPVLSASPEPPATDEPIVRTRLGGGWGGGLAIAVHPGVGLGLDGALRVQSGRWTGELGVWLSGAPAWLDGAVAGGRVRSGAVGAGLWGCRALGGRRSWSACLGARLGIEAHAGLDFSQDAHSVGPWLAAGGRLTWWMFEGWGPRATVLVPLGELLLTVDGREAWSRPAAGAVLGLGGRL